MRCPHCKYQLSIKEVNSAALHRHFKCSECSHISNLNIYVDIAILVIFFAFWKGAECLIPTIQEYKILLYLLLPLLAYGLVLVCQHYFGKLVMSKE